MTISTKIRQPLKRGAEKQSQETTSIAQLESKYIFQAISVPSRMLYMNPSGPGGAGNILNCSLMSKHWRCLTPLLYQSSESSYVYVHFCLTLFTSVHQTSEWKSFETCLNYTTACLLNRNLAKQRGGICNYSMSKIHFASLNSSAFSMVWNLASVSLNGVSDSVTCC